MHQTALAGTLSAAGPAIKKREGKRGLKGTKLSSKRRVSVSGRNYHGAFTRPKDGEGSAFACNDGSSSVNLRSAAFNPGTTFFVMSVCLV